uniref:Uncharacterized protein n=1 Tax=Anser cygnoides TaxID=8845 RepID=A0A8B9IG16_ANSCY
DVEMPPAPQDIGGPSIYHAVEVIFLEFVFWGLLTTPRTTVLHEMFPHHMFLMNGLIQGSKGVLSDAWGRKSFLLTVFFTCAPIPLLRISPWWRSHRPWGCSRKGWMFCLGTWSSG